MKMVSIIQLFLVFILYSGMITKSSDNKLLVKSPIESTKDLKINVHNNIDSLSSVLDKKISFIKKLKNVIKKQQKIIENANK